MRSLLLLFFVLLSVQLYAQEPLPEIAKDTTFYTKVDSLYREDQFYFGVTYNGLQKTPAKFSQNGFSTGLHFGFMRDMPVNKKRTVAFALGLGLSYNKYHQDLKVGEDGGVRTYEILEDESYSRNKMEQVFMELPFEFRWRNSTFTSHKFWRIYSGFKVRYLIFDKAKFVGDENIVVLRNDDFNRLQYGPYIAFGYNTWNFHAYYGLNSLFKDSAQVNGRAIEIQTLNIGLMFYIL
jgi:hypothetical protein